MTHLWQCFQSIYEQVRKSKNVAASYVIANDRIGCSRPAGKNYRKVAVASYIWPPKAGDLLGKRCAGRNVNLPRGNLRRHAVGSPDESMIYKGSRYARLAQRLGRAFPGGLPAYLVI